jgi:hypothetical protein
VTQTAMLTDVQKRKIRRHWGEVVLAHNAIRGSKMAGMSGGIIGGFPTAVMKLADVANCMLVFMAFSTLEMFLIERETVIGLVGKRSGLKKLMKESRKAKDGVGALSWEDSPLVNEGRCLRDQLAHHHLTEESLVTLTYVKAVQDELVRWVGDLEMIDFSVYKQLKRWGSN